MKKLAVLKIYPELNVGDDLFLSILLDRYSEVDFYLLANKSMYNKFIHEHPNLKIIDTLQNINLFDRLLLKLSTYFSESVQERVFKDYVKKQYGEKLLNTDFFVTIGGSMFIENKNDKINRSLLFYQVINTAFKNKPRYFIGCNFGPYYSDNFLNNFKVILGEATDLSFRDRESEDILKLPNLRINPDIVFGFKVETIPHKIPNSVGFVLVDPRIKMPNLEISYSHYVSEIQKLIGKYINNGSNVTLFSYCKKENDEVLINDVLAQKELLNKNINVVKYEGELNSFIDQYSKMEMVFCGRFHSMILSMLFDQRMLPLIYSKKMTNILEDINFSGDVVELNSLNSEEHERYLQMARNNRYNIEELKKSANCHFEKIDQLIK